MSIWRSPPRAARSGPWPHARRRSRPHLNKLADLIEQQATRSRRCRDAASRSRRCCAGPAGGARHAALLRGLRRQDQRPGHPGVAGCAHPYGARAGRRRRAIVPWNFPPMIGMEDRAGARLRLHGGACRRDHAAVGAAHRRTVADAGAARVFNIVPGFGNWRAGAEHPDVDKVTLTARPWSAARFSLGPLAISSA